MTVKNIIDKCGLNIINGENFTDRTVEGCYVGDLLSWAMGKVRENNVWLTVMGNVNAIAVAVLADAACVVLVDGSTLDEIALRKAVEREVIVLSTDKTAYEVAVMISEMN